MVIKIIVSSLMFVIVSFAISILTIFLRRHGEINSSTLHPPKIIFWIGITDIVFLVVMDIVLLATEKWEELLVSIIPIVCFVPIGIWLMLYALNWQIVLGDDGFTYRNMFGKKKTYKYEDITALKRIKIGGYRMYFGKKSIAVDYFVSGQDVLWDKIKVMDIPMKK